MKKSISRSPAPSKRDFRKYLDLLARELFSNCPEALKILVDLTRSGIRDVREIAIKMFRRDAERLAELIAMYKDAFRNSKNTISHAINDINRFLADIEARPALA